MQKQLMLLMSERAKNRDIYYKVKTKWMRLVKIGKQSFDLFFLIAINLLFL